MSNKIIQPLDSTLATEQGVVPKQVTVHTPAIATQVIVVGHSAIFYWWPLWVAGYIMSLLTWSNHDQVQIGSKMEWFYRGRDLGVIYTSLLLLLILISSTKIKGMKAALLIAAASFLILFSVHLEWWGVILGWFGNQSISLSLGYYLFSSTLLLVVWATSVFFVDRLSFWRFRPGQVTHEFLGGIVNNTYDTQNMTISLNRQDDFFRHWIIGMGSGDLHIRTMGGRGVEMFVTNVLFVGSKMKKIQALIATKPAVPLEA
ncbi:hypothetical protein KIH39_09305 [Telmatocola sphagniphila]|uniref:Uncharacterized protein n=1 Tax=Telmatocola sphagniphila TaxID=1123043 RepID=A0A8E6EUT7_9BACT|nr:hypothetical protein [Telmatocola sphagniphila]QVL34084.1 hypothetical protein KIH39_09305 [Telmatocola sphagniphila]